ncbi:hypothetical protein ACLMJK_004261 [Lecanora helva]
MPQITVHHLPKGPNTKPIPLQSDELAFLYERHVDFMLAYQSTLSPSNGPVKRGKVPWKDMDWEEITFEFNDRFAGEEIEGTEGRIREGMTWWELRKVCRGLKSVRQLKGGGFWGRLRAMW